MKIYTKTGDKGETGLYGGQRVAKDDIRVHAYGDVDELNSNLGVVIALGCDAEINSTLLGIQSKLFSLGADLATPNNVSQKLNIIRIDSEDVNSLELEIDNYEAKLKKLQHFILPGGSKTGAFLFLARACCRRAERNCVTLSQQTEINAQAIIYLNRLSDLLFVLARYENQMQHAAEVEWIAN